MNPAPAHERIEQILARRLRAVGFDRHAALRFAQGASAEILPALREPSRAMRDAADEACVGMPGPADYWRTMIDAAIAAVPNRTSPRKGDLFELTEAEPAE